MTGEGDAILSIILSHLISTSTELPTRIPFIPHLHISPSFHYIILIIPFHFTLYIFALPTY